METPERRALARARANAQATLDRMAADTRLAPGNRRSGDYWAGALAATVRQLLDATAADGGAS